jgi:hypothetical protein
VRRFMSIKLSPSSGFVWRIAWERGIGEGICIDPKSEGMKITV